MILVGLTLLTVLGLIPLPWGAALVAGALLLEVVETLYWYRVLRRRRPVVGPGSLVGERGTVVRSCCPEGQVRVRGELWRAHCDAGAEAGERVRVRAVEGLNLVVEPVT